MLRQLMLKHVGMRRMFDRECAECNIRRYIGRCSVNSWKSRVWWGVWCNCQRRECAGSCICKWLI